MGSDLSRRDGTDTGGGELDGQGDPVESSTKANQDRGVDSTDRAYARGICVITAELLTTQAQLAVTREAGCRHRAGEGAGRAV
jgi:hypothetical protein